MFRALVSVWSAQHGCSYKEVLHSGETRGQTGSSVAASTALILELRGIVTDGRERFAFTLLLLLAVFCPGLCHLHWKMFPSSLLELWVSPGLIGTDKLWRPEQCYAPIEFCTTQITHAWHECIQTDKLLYFFLPRLCLFSLQQFWRRFWRRIFVSTDKSSFVLFPCGVKSFLFLRWWLMSSRHRCLSVLMHHSHLQLFSKCSATPQTGDAWVDCLSKLILRCAKFLFYDSITFSLAFI